MTRPTHHVGALQHRDTPWVDDVTLWGGHKTPSQSTRPPSDLAEMKGTELCARRARNSHQPIAEVGVQKCTGYSPRTAVSEVVLAIRRDLGVSQMRKFVPGALFLICISGFLWWVSGAFSVGRQPAIQVDQTSFRERTCKLDQSLQTIVGKIVCICTVLQCCND